LAVTVLREQSYYLVMLIKITDARDTSSLEGFTAKLPNIVEPIRKTVTCDVGKEICATPK